MYSYQEQQILTDLTDQNIDEQYNKGYVFTRLGKGVMHRVRSLRVDLTKFLLTSENRRVLKKSERVSCEFSQLPYQEYHWSIGKMASDFYSTKFGEGTMSANKIKEMFCDHKKSNMNSVLVYRSCHPELAEGLPIGYCLAFQTKNILHYSYPFYQLPTSHYSLGIAMMTKAVVFAKESGRKYIYLGSVHEPKAAYKLQFEGLEWWDGNEWLANLSKLKNFLSKQL